MAKTPETFDHHYDPIDVEEVARSVVASLNGRGRQVPMEMARIVVEKLDGESRVKNFIPSIAENILSRNTNPPQLLQETTLTFQDQT